MDAIIQDMRRMLAKNPSKTDAKYLAVLDVISHTESDNALFQKVKKLVKAGNIDKAKKTAMKIFDSFERELAIRVITATPDNPHGRATL